tara:strand:+ start:201 stop:1256 length:1056 start_codon:yes stop_codon:yes gene_type:complete
MAVYTSINDPSAFFQVALWTGNSSSTQAITNDGTSNLQPDFVWLKRRSDAENHTLADTSRGITKRMVSNSDAAENTADGVVSVQSDGFTVGGGYNGNTNGATYVGWQWKANGGTTASNTTGSTNVTTQVNSTAGFSIITGNGSSSAGQTFGHGLSQAPEFFTFRMKDETAHWICYHKDMGPGHYLRLDQNVTKVSNTNIFSNTDPSSTLIYYGGNSMFTSNAPFICYAFHSVQGYSKFGTYTGNGSSDGPFIYTGFKPAYVVTKTIDTTANQWAIKDHRRNPHNERTLSLYANLNNADDTGGGNIALDFLSNGFKCRKTDSQINENGTAYIYLAFAESPFVSSTGVPTVAE